MDETEAHLAEERASQERHGRRIEVITSQLVVAAHRLNTVCEQLTPELELPKYYQFDDFVVAVRLFETTSDETKDSDEEHLVVIQHYVELVGVDKRSGYIGTCRIGMLAWLRYDSIYKTFVKAPTYMDFDVDRVKEALRGGLV